jgi:hypothetical protein
MQMVSGCDWWRWTKPGYITMAQRESNNQFSSSIAAYPPQNILSAKIRWKISCLFWGGIKTASSSLIIFRRAKTINAEYYSSLLAQFKKNATGRLQKSSCSCITMPYLNVHWQPWRNWPTWASNVLITNPTLWIWPLPTNTFSFRQGLSFCRDLVRRAIFWIVFSGLQKLEQEAKKCFELRGSVLNKSHVWSL